VNDAIFICKGCNTLSPYYFQRVLTIDLDTAQRIFDELEDVGLLVNTRHNEYDDEAIIADVNLEKLQELQTN